MFVVCCNSDPARTTECSGHSVINVTDPYLSMAFNDHLPELKQRIDSGEIPVDYVDEDPYRKHNTLMHAAVAGRAFGVIDFLRQRFVSLNRLNDFGYSAWHLAVLADDQYMLNLLKETFGHDINQMTRKGMSSLYLAVVKNKLNSVVFLLEAGADQSIVGPDGRTALKYGVKNNLLPFWLSSKFTPE